jgi:hypothetical protein
MVTTGKWHVASKRVTVVRAQGSEYVKQLAWVWPEGTGTGWTLGQH